MVAGVSPGVFPTRRVEIPPRIHIAQITQPFDPPGSLVSSVAHLQPIHVARQEERLPPTLHDKIAQPPPEKPIYLVRRAVVDGAEIKILELDLEPVLGAWYRIVSVPR
jgi:hypothetical protein